MNPAAADKCRMEGFYVDRGMLYIKIDAVQYRILAAHINFKCDQNK